MDGKPLKGVKVVPLQRHIVLTLQKLILKIRSKVNQNCSTVLLWVARQRFNHRGSYLRNRTNETQLIEGLLANLD